MSPAGITLVDHSTTSYRQLRDVADELEALARREASDARQWRIHLIAIFIIVVSQVVNLLRGSPRRESIIGIEKCGKADWIITITYIILIVSMTIYAVNKARKE